MPTASMLDTSQRSELSKLKLTKKQEIFVNEFVATGDKRHSYEVAGFSNNTASRLLKRPEILEEIRIRTEQAKLNGIATGTDAMLFLSQVMNGEIKDQFGLDATLRDRLEACKEILKRTKDIELKERELKNKADNEFHLSIDWTRNSEPTVKDTINESEIIEVDDEQEERY